MIKPKKINLDNNTHSKNKVIKNTAKLHVIESSLKAKVNSYSSKGMKSVVSKFRKKQFDYSQVGRIDSIGDRDVLAVVGDHGLLGRAVNLEARGALRIEGDGGRAFLRPGEGRRGGEESEREK